MNIEQKPLQVNFTRGRPGRPDVIVVHIQEGTMEGTDSWFRSARSRVSAHYGVARDGRVWQWVDDRHQAWHAGKKVRATAPIVVGRTVSPNTYSIGIEFEGEADQEPTEAQLERGAELLRMLSARHSIPLNRRHVVEHREIRADKSCPGRMRADLLLERTSARTRVLRRGDTGPDVEALQALLVRLGYMTEAQVATGRGIFGPRTEAAFAVFLEAHTH